MPQSSPPGSVRITMQLDPEDKLRIENLKQVLGYTSRTPIIRMALRFFYVENMDLMRQRGISPEIDMDKSEPGTSTEPEAPPDPFRGTCGICGLKIHVSDAYNTYTDVAAQTQDIAHNRCFHQLR